MGIKVSVVVPVYNPGPYIEPCIDSLLAQTMPAEHLELIFVNDGSTDDAVERLERHAAVHPQVKVLTIPNSGWPGKPRNVGTDAARGEYVMYVDQDDRVEPQALARMHDLGAANSADVVLGKVISDFRGVHHNLYRVSRPACNVFSADLMNSLTPHKMLRTAFLREHDIRYPEGPRRLEDQLFMTRAYFAAKTASIVADYVCYRYLRRPDGKNAGSKRIEPAGYYANLGEVLDVVDAHTDSGPQRDRFYRRFLRTEMLGRLDIPNLLTAPADYVSSLQREITGLLKARFPETVDEGFGAALRARAALTRNGTLSEIAAQAESIRNLQAVGKVTDCRATGSVMEIDVEVRLVHQDSPLLLQRHEEGWLLPTALTGPVTAPAQRRVEDVADMSGDVIIRHRQLSDEWFLPGSLVARLDETGDHAEVIWSGTAQLDPRRAAAGAPLRDGLHDLHVRVEAFGLSRGRRLAAEDRPVGSILPLVVDRRDRISLLYETTLQNLSVNVNARPKWLTGALESAAFVEHRPSRLTLDVPVSWARPPRTAQLIVDSPSGPPLSWELTPVPGCTQWTARTNGNHRQLQAGEHPVRLRLWFKQGAAPLEVTLEAPLVVTRREHRSWLVKRFRRAVVKRLRRARRVARRGARRARSLRR